MLLLLLALTPLCTGEANPAPVRTTPLDAEAPFRRFLWVTRWDYRTPEDIDRICYNAASARFTDLFFQVRGEGTVFFQSPHEPWAWELSGLPPDRGVGVDPGWDPLKTAIRSARRYGLRIHAYLNTLPVWAQDRMPPAESGQVYARHPDWLMVDAEGRRICPDGFYAFLDPGLPQVRRHLATLIGRLVWDYPVDGVHLDYIRYPLEKGEYSFHPDVVARFRQRYGAAAPLEGEPWNSFRREQITELVRLIRRAVERSRPGIELSAAVIADPIKRRERAGQDVERWLAAGLIDAVAPMVYVEEAGEFDRLVQFYREGPHWPRVWPGIRADEKNPNLPGQIGAARSIDAAGVAVFSYVNLFPNHAPTKTALTVYRAFVERNVASLPGRESAADASDRPALPRKTRNEELKVRF